MFQSLPRQFSAGQLNTLGLKSITNNWTCVSRASDETVTVLPTVLANSFKTTNAGLFGGNHQLQQEQYYGTGITNTVGNNVVLATMVFDDPTSPNYQSRYDVISDMSGEFRLEI